MPHSKIISFIAGFLMLLPLASIAQTADQGELIQQLTQQAAKLQIQLDQLRQTTPPSFSLPNVSQQLNQSKKTFLEKLLHPAKHPVNPALSSGNQPEDEDTTAPATFDRDLYLGLRNDSDVSNLQEFLTDQGFYNQTISGSFFILTRNAVKKFQRAHGIKPTGFFGSQSRAVANALMQGTATITSNAGDTAAATRRGDSAAMNLAALASTTPPTMPIVSVPPTREQDGTRPVRSLPLSLSLKLAKDSYELDERLDGTGSIVNLNLVPAQGKFNLELYYKETRVATTTLDFPCTPGAAPSCIPAGTTPINPADVFRALIGLDSIPPNPDLIGSWKMVMSMIPGDSTVPPVRIELPFTITAQKPATISVNGGNSQGKIGLQGLELIPAEPVSAKTRDLIAQLKPQLWRIFLAVDVERALSYQPKKLTYDTEAGYYYLVQKPGAQCGADNNPVNCLPGTLPWEDNYAIYRRYVTDVITAIVKDKIPVDYLEWWNESDIVERFGTDRQMFETFKVFHDTVRSISPNQKIAAPTATIFNQPYLRAFLDYAADNRLKIDALSWHEWDPSHISKNVQIVRDLFVQNPRYCSLKCPEIHINEFNAISHYFIPGWQGAYLANFENSNVDWGGSPSCFAINLPGGKKMSTCYSAYNGFFIQDNETPQPLYWVRRAYADMQSDTKLQINSSSARTAAVASKSDSEKTVRVLVSRYSCGKNGKWCLSGDTFYSDEQKAPPIPVTLSIVNYPYGGTSVQAHISGIPNEGVPGPLLQPIDMGTTTLSVINGKVTYTIPQYQDGDVYNIIIAPATQAPTISQIIPPTGPIGAKVILTGTGFTPTGNTINFGGVPNAVINLDSADGKTLTFTVPSQLCNQLSGSAVCPPLKVGIYGVSVTNTNGTSNAVKFMITQSANGSLVIDPASAALKVGEVIRVRAYYQPPMPPCPSGMRCIQVMPPQQEVLASFASDNPHIAVVEEIEDKSCASPRMCPVAIRHSAVRGVSAGSATITASLYTDAAGTFTATMKVVVGGNADRARGSLSLDPPSAMLAVGETVKVKAIFTPPRPACLDAVPACEMPEQAPYEVDVALVSSDKSIALTMCPTESGRLTCIGSNGVRGVSPGKATVTGTYTTARDTFVAAIHVAVTAAATTTITTL